MCLLIPTILSTVVPLYYYLSIVVYGNGALSLALREWYVHTRHFALTFVVVIPQMVRSCTHFTFVISSFSVGTISSYQSAFNFVRRKLTKLNSDGCPCHVESKPCCLSCCRLGFVSLASFARMTLRKLGLSFPGHVDAALNSGVSHIKTTLR